MATDTFIQLYRVLISLAFVVSFLNWLGYTVLAPWYKSSWGRVVWTKFTANMLVLLVPFVQINFNDFPFRRELSLFAMLIFIVAISIVGWYIYTRQLKGYIKKRFQRTTKENKNANVA